MTQPTVLITGGSRGIGAACAKLAAQRGWNVVITYRKNECEALSVVSDIEDLGQKALAMQVDIGSEADIKSLFKTIDVEFKSLNALINNAGMITPISPFMEMTKERIVEVFNVNVIGCMICAQEAIKRMAQSKGGQGGAIVNLSSAASRLGSPNEFIDYAASKGAIDTLTVGLSKEFASEGIRVNAVRPGLIATGLHADAGDANRPEKLKQNIPMKRAGHALEVASAIIWLISEESSYVTGAVLDVTGGR